MHWTAYPAATLVGAVVTIATIGMFGSEPPPDYVDPSGRVPTWQVTRVRTVPYDGPAMKLQKPHEVDRVEDLCIERFAKLPALVERLKVPQTDDVEPSVVIEMCDGRKWDVFDILMALLDRMEQK